MIASTGRNSPIEVTHEQRDRMNITRRYGEGVASDIVILTSLLQKIIVFESADATHPLVAKPTDKTTMHNEQ